ncbi:anhydro-N-acetylmuramic acid kinase [Sedimentibacter acidaminivorans]|uniref:Anhydro-N-acetylmuramic acid kinase n=1 Tax=Sedimentibacter acidaminivorans TaxID=913099 RepID=A0ABS4GG64_9FIRM|nr:anhydro-N-acetylmuramic acid kinase [Sedimentibacter acidaminivorans]MBP1926627.1 anhydro-N-acetylmuramic acid kinase [Sedimentibacter acidaminivorans]
MIDTIKKVVEKPIKLAIGLMSGTSLDGIDACVVEIKGSGKNTEINFMDFITLEYTKSEKERILKLCNINTSTVDEICYMNNYLGNKMGEAALKVCKEANINIKDIDFISSHGQTIYHMPNLHSTLQIGELANIASVTGCLTVGDFRPSDMAYGGQGAPLVPYIDYLLFSSEKKGRVLLNLGGIGNITVLKSGGEEEDVYAFDTGPANVLIDEVARIITDGKMTFDADGKMASMGNINEQWLEEMITQDSYLCKNPPKSTGREYYTTEFAKKLYDEGKVKGLSSFDIISTITAFTAKTIQNQLEKFVLENHKVDEIYVSGGGAHNQMIMKLLSEYIDAEVSCIDKLDFIGDAKESIAFAVLGNEFLHGNANNIPTATGANRKVIMGKLVLPSV